MIENGFKPPFAKINDAIPLWCVAELTYRCPLRCFYCSNPANQADTYKNELSTEEWIKTLTQARELGAVQLGLTGGEPLLRNDLEVIVEHARNLGFYTNLVTSGIGLTEARIERLRKSGLDHIQLSFQASHKELNDYIGGSKSFEAKIKAAQLIKKHQYPMVLNVVISKLNISNVPQILDLALSLDADYVELANVQYEGWAMKNRHHLLPTLEQVKKAQDEVDHFRKQNPDRFKLFYVLPDYYQDRPKACSAGWGSLLMVVAPDGLVLPCHGARKLPEISFSNVREQDLKWIWKHSPSFNAFRGDSWMKAPCSSCPEKKLDFGGCRCQAFELTGDARNADPVCQKSPNRFVVNKVLEEVQTSSQKKFSDQTEIYESTLKNEPQYRSNTTLRENSLLSL